MCPRGGKSEAGGGGGERCQRARAQQGDAASLKMNASFDLFPFFYFFAPPPQQRVIHLSPRLLAIYMRARLKITVCSLRPPARSWSSSRLAAV